MAPRSHKLQIDLAEKHQGQVGGNAQPPLLELDRRNSLAHAIVATVREPLIVLDRKLRVVAASRSFLGLFQMKIADVRGRPFFELRSGQWNAPALRRLLLKVIADNRAIESYEVEIEVPAIGRRRLILNARQVLDDKSPHTAVLVGLEDVTERREAESLKDAILQEQKLLLLEAQHRIANSLQIIASILLLKARSVQSNDTRLHLRDVHNRVVLIADVQRQLCTSGLVDEIELGPYLSSLCEGLFRSMVSDDRALTIKTSATHMTVKSEEAVSLGLVVTELVINALKYAFPDGRKGHIAVDFVGDKSGWRLSVSDSGVGRQLDSSKPDHVGLGTTIVEALARKLKATVQVIAGLPGSTTALVHSG
jgi:chemotaxis protein methyltransferase CheR